MDSEAELKALLVLIRENDEAYDVRYGLVLRAVGEAVRLGLVAGYRTDPAEPEWPTAYIELPTGQVSWHVPQHPHPWDGHTGEERYRRLTAYAEPADAPRDDTLGMAAALDHARALREAH